MQGSRGADGGHPGRGARVHRQLIDPGVPDVVGGKDAAVAYRWRLGRGKAGDSCDGRETNQGFYQSLPSELWRDMLFSVDAKSVGVCLSFVLLRLVSGMKANSSPSSAMKPTFSRCSDKSQRYRYRRWRFGSRTIWLKATVVRCDSAKLGGIIGEQRRIIRHPHGPQELTVGTGDGVIGRRRKAILPQRFRIS